MEPIHSVVQSGEFISGDEWEGMSSLLSLFSLRGSLADKAEHFSSPILPFLPCTVICCETEGARGLLNAQYNGDGMPPSRSSPCHDWVVFGFGNDVGGDVGIIRNNKRQMRRNEDSSLAPILANGIWLCLVGDDILNRRLTITRPTTGPSSFPIFAFPMDAGSLLHNVARLWKQQDKWGVNRRGTEEST